MTYNNNKPFTLSAKLYNDLYTKDRDYYAQSEVVSEWIKSKNPQAKKLLDIACGTGLHLNYLKDEYNVAGLDINTEMIQLAKDQNPDIPIYKGDMRTFKLHRKFDVIICLFSSITHCETINGLNQTLCNLYDHLNENGICIIEPFITPDKWVDGKIGIRTYESENKKISMIDIAKRIGSVVNREIAYTYAHGNSIEQFKECYSFPIFSEQQYINSFESAGFNVSYLINGLITNRGMYIGQKNTLQQ